MAGFDEIYMNLPGHTVTLRDGHLQLRQDPNPPATDSLLLVGTAVDGPTGLPVGVDSATAERLFGKAVDARGRANGGTLQIGFEEAWQKGARDVRLLRIGGEKAKFTLGPLSFESPYGGKLYNEIAIDVTEVLAADGVTVAAKVLSITKPETKKLAYAEPPLTYSTEAYPTLGELVRAVNEDPRARGIVQTSIALSDMEVDALASLPVTAKTNFAGGDDGVRLTRKQMFEALFGVKDASGNRIQDGVMHALENYAVDYIVILGVNADDDPSTGNPTDNFAHQLATSCAVISHRNHMVHGFMATSSPNTVDLQAVNEHVAKLLAKPNNFFLLGKDGLPVKDPDTGKFFDVGGYLSILAGPDQVLRNSRLGTYAANSAAAYAGFITTLKVKQSPMNKALPATPAVRYTYGNPQLDKLTSARYVTLRIKGEGMGNPVVSVVDSVTCAQADSDFTRLESFRAVKAAVDQVRQACDPFMGESNDDNNKNAMSTAIDKALLLMKQDGAIQSYSFAVLASLVDQVLGNSQIDLTIVPPFINRRISTTVGLAARL